MTPTEESFLNDVAQHQMTAVHADGVHRHLHFAKPGSGDMHFDIVTWPGYLCYSGDMGSYVFSRCNDMLQFFRGKEEGPLRINLKYWSEKLDATDRNDGHKEYSADKFREYVADRLKDFQTELAEAYEADPDDKSEFDALKEAVDEYVLAYADDGEFQAHQVLDEFEHDDHRWFTDSYEANFDEYTFRFIWCCYALAWAIRVYDESLRVTQK